MKGLQHFKHAVDQSVSCNAVVDRNGRAYTYEDINGLSSKLTCVMRSECKELAGKPLVLLFDRSVEYVIAILASWKAKAYFVPVSIDTPSARLQYILSVLKPEAVLYADQTLVEQLNIKGRLINVDLDSLSYAQEVTSHRGGARLSDDHPAYAIFTSGTTGYPKGVLVGHRGLSSLPSAYASQLGIGANSRILQYFPIAFDANIFEVFSAILMGGSLYMPGREVFSDSEALLEYINENKITNVQLPPDVLSRLDTDRITNTITFLVGGESYPLAVVEPLLGRHRVVNVYGPTECTMWVTSGVIDRPERIQVIGQAVSSSMTEVISDSAEVVSIGEIGELVVWGDSLALGYLNVDHFEPLHTTQIRMASGELVYAYQTGDLVRKLSSGEYEFVSRKDFQVKIKGFRVELPEIERTIASFPGVNDAAVCVIPGENGADDQLFALCVWDKKEGDRSIAALENGLRERLPYYMWPRKILETSSIPRGDSGKIVRTDVVKLINELKIEETMTTALDKNNDSGLLEVMGVVYTGILNYKDIGADTSFIFAGGNSLHVSLLLAKVNACLSFPIKSHEFYRNSILRDFVSLVEERLSLSNSPNSELSSLVDLSQEFVDVVDDKLNFVDASRPWTLAHNQLNMLLNDQGEGGSGAYNLCWSMAFRVNLDMDLALRALAAEIYCHPSLISHYINGNGVVAVSSTEEIKPFIECIDLESRNGAEGEVCAIASRLVRQKFLLSSELPFRAVIVRRRGYLEILLVVHHVAFDGPSIQILAERLHRQVTGEYDDDWKHTHAQFFRTMAMATQLREGDDAVVSFWKDKLSQYGMPSYPVGCGELKQIQGSNSRDAQFLRINLGDNALLQSEKYGCSVFIYLLSALVSGYRLQDGFIEKLQFMLAVNERSMLGIGYSIGCFAKTLPLVIGLQHVRGKDELVRHVARSVEDIMDHQAISSDQLAELISITTSLDWKVPKDVVVTFVQLDSKVSSSYDIRYTPPATTKSGLEIQFIFDGKRAEAVLLYDCRFCESGAIEGFGQAIRAGMSYLESDLDNLFIKECWPQYESVANSYQKRWSEISDPTCKVYQSICKNLSSLGSVVAIDDQGRKVTYDDLYNHAKHLAGELLRGGVGEGALIGVRLPQGEGYITAVLSIWFIGATYVPMDPSWPDSRTDSVCKNLNFVIAGDESKYDFGVPTLNVNLVFEGNLCSGDRIQEKVEPPLSPAYVIFTSGTTGVPKGAAISHQALNNRIEWMQEEMALSSQDIFLAKTPVTFDVSVWEYIMPLVLGGRVVIPPQRLHNDPETIRSLLIDKHVTIVHFVPSILQVMMHAWSESIRFASVRHMICSGEPLTTGIVVRAASFFTDNIWNLYGPTEAAIDVTHFKVNRDNLQQLVTLGTPAKNVVIYIVDESSSLQPDYCVGEILISGIQVGEGYVGVDEKKNHAFGDDPFAPNQRLYRTGDYGYRLHDGSIVYLGRRDDQAKIFGQRFELGEIETAALSLNGISEVAAVLIRSHSETELVLFVVNEVEHRLAEEDIKADLRERLPKALIPSRIIYVDSIPKTLSGKCDRSQLRAGLSKIKENDYSRKGEIRDLASLVHNLFANVLGIEISAFTDEDDFFALGGTSISAAKVITSLRNTYGHELSARVFYNGPTVSYVVSNLIRNKENDSSDETKLILRDIAEPFKDFAKGIASAGTQVLVSGAAGFLGINIIDRLSALANVNKIFCLIRAKDDDAALEKLRQSYIKYLPESEFPGHKVQVVLGDVSQKTFCALTVYNELIQRVSSVYHCAAEVNFVEPYSKLRSSNVLGTRHLIEFCLKGMSKQFNYISSSAVYGARGYFEPVTEFYEELDITNSLKYLYGGYIQTKWASERLITFAGSNGLRYRIFRCGLILGDSRLGICNPNDFPSRLIAASARLNAFYTLPGKTDNFIPVDVAASSIVKIAQDDNSAGMAFHIVNPHTIPYEEFWEAVNRCGYSLEKNSFEEWSEKFELELSQISDNHPLLPLAPLFYDKVYNGEETVIELFQNLPPYRVDNVKRFISDFERVCPRIDDDLVGVWVGYYRKIGLL